LSGADRSANPKGINFLVANSNSPMKRFLDPWGNPYYITFLAGSEHLPGNLTSAQIIPAQVRIWSDGPGSVGIGGVRPSGGSDRNGR